MTHPARTFTAEPAPADATVSALDEGVDTNALQLDPKAVVRFPHGLPGFETCHTFALLSPDETAPMQVLHAVDGPNASFLTIDPRLVLPGYRYDLGAADSERIGVEDPEALVWLAIVTVEPSGTVTVNLRAPVVINPQRMVGFQVMPYQCVYPLRHVLVRQS